MLTTSVAAIAAGQFKDDDAAAVEGLSDLGGGRIWANRDELVRTGTQQMMSRMDPRAMQYPEMFGKAARGFPSRRQEQPPGERLIPISPPTSKFGIVISPDTPIRTLTDPRNKLKQHTYAARNGNMHGNLRLRAPTIPYPRPGLSHSGAQLVAPRKPNPRIQGLLSATGTSRANNTPVAASLLDRKRANAVFEEKIKYVKGGGTDLNKYVWAIVLLSPAEAPHMGYFTLFLKKKEAYSLENEVVLNIVRGEAEKGNQVVLGIKENEVRESSHTLVFETAAKAKDFLATVSRLLNGGIDIITQQTPVIAVVVPEELNKATTTTTQDVAGLGVTPTTENTLTSSVPTVVSPAQPKVEDVLAPTAPAVVQPSHIESLELKAALDSVNDDEAGTLADLITIPSTHGTVDHEVANAHGKEPNTAQVKANLPDLLSGEDDTTSDSVIETTIDAAQAADSVAGSDVQGLESPLFDLGADELSPPRSRLAFTSNAAQLEGLDAWYQASPETTCSGHQDHNVVNNDTGFSEKTPGQGDDDAQRMLQCLRAMVENLLLGFGNAGVAGNTSAELKRTIMTIKQTVAGSIRAYAPDASYFPNLTERQKLQVVEDFIAEPEDTQEVTAIRSSKETSVPAAGSCPRSSTATAVDSSPPRVPRIEYSAQRLLDARPDAVAPPEWLKKLDFLPLVPGREPAKGPIEKKPVKPESFAQAAPSRSPTPIKPGTDGVELERSVSITPFGRNVVTRPAAPPTPVRSPSPAVAKLESKFEKLTLRDEPAKSPAPTVKVEDAPGPVQQSTPVPRPANPPSAHTLKAKKPSPSVAQPVPLTHKGPLAERKPGTNGTAAAAGGSKFPTQPKVETFGSKDLDCLKNELETNIRGAAFNIPQQARPTAAGPPAAKAENVQPQAVTAVDKSNGHANGQLTPSGLNPQAAHFHPPPTNQPTGPAQQKVAPGGGIRGLNNSRWATPTEAKVEKEGRFTGLHFKKPH